MEVEAGACVPNQNLLRGLSEIVRVCVVGLEVGEWK